MERLQALYYRKVAMTDLSFKRYLYPKINWDNRLIVIKGAKGVGKTTLMLQHIKEAFADDLSKALSVPSERRALHPCFQKATSV